MCKLLFLLCMACVGASASASPFGGPDGNGQSDAGKAQKSESQQVLILAEPATLLATGLGLSLAVWHRRRRRRD
jgi:hypothetical protein